MNGLRNKITELTHLITITQPKIVTIQETKLNSKIKIPDIPDFTTIRKDRTTDGGGGLITYIHHSIQFTEIQTPTIDKLETLITKLETNPPLHISNCYFPLDPSPQTLTITIRPPFSPYCLTLTTI